MEARRLITTGITASILLAGCTDPGPHENPGGDAKPGQTAASSGGCKPRTEIFNGGYAVRLNGLTDQPVEPMVATIVLEDAARSILEYPSPAGTPVSFEGTATAYGTKEQHEAARTNAGAPIVLAAGSAAVGVESFVSAEDPDRLKRVTILQETAGGVSPAGVAVAPPTTEQGYVMVEVDVLHPCESPQPGQ